MQEAHATGRDALIEAARSLFASHGIEAVSMREVGRTAGQRNTNAVQYHFGDRGQLLHAVLEQHHGLVSARRAALLDEIDLQPSSTLRDIAGALVRPNAALLEHPSGRDYLRIVAELITEPANLRRGPLRGMGLSRWDRTARGHMPTTTLPLHRRFSAINLAFTELGRRAAARRRTDHRLFVSDLVDLTTGVLSADVSDETLRLLDERDG